MPLTDLYASASRSVVGLMSRMAQARVGEPIQIVSFKVISTAYIWPSFRFSVSHKRSNPWRYSCGRIAVVLRSSAQIGVPQGATRGVNPVAPC